MSPGAVRLSALCSVTGGRLLPEHRRCTEQFGEVAQYGEQFGKKTQGRSKKRKKMHNSSITISPQLQTHRRKKEKKK